jgi:polyhydroxybutyrate depolymerase
MNNSWSNHWAVLGGVLIVLGIAIYFEVLPEPGIVANAVDFPLNLEPGKDGLSNNDGKRHHRNDHPQKHDGRNTSIPFASTEKSASVFFQTNSLRQETLMHDDVERTFSFYAPNTLESKSVPIVFLLHGGGGNIESTWEQEYGRNFREIADQDGFMLVLPQGREDPGNPGEHHWNDCRTDISNADVNSKLDDVGFINAIIDMLMNRFEIDLNRVYVTGASNGGMMSYRLAMELGQRFAAVGAVIANMPDPSECAQPEQPVSMLIMNGTDDPLMNYEGGCIANTTCRRGNVSSTDDAVQFWVSHNQTNADAVVEALPDRVNLDRSTVTKFMYSGGLKNTEVVLFRINNGGHTVPGDEPLGLLARRVVGEKNRDINGPEEIWNFFQQHTR